MTYPLAGKTTKIISSNTCENFGLLYYRLPEIQIKDKFSKDKKNFESLLNLAAASETIYRNQCPVIKALEKRFDSLQQFAENQGSKCLNFSLKVDWRLVIGLGNPSVYDTGLRLHSIYGFPYLPGQGLKGAVRRVWMLETTENLGIPVLEVAKFKQSKVDKIKTPWEKFENLLMTAIDPDSKPYSEEKSRVQKDFANLQKDCCIAGNAEIKKLAYEKFWHDYASFYQAVFGGINGQGKVDFLDVFPTELIGDDDKSILEIDIINVHYGEYYTSKGKNPPADYLSPNPIFFLCVRAGTPFQFRAIMNAEVKDKTAEIKELIMRTAGDYGLGAKTMAGYGEMS